MSSDTEAGQQTNGELHGGPPSSETGEENVSNFRKEFEEEKKRSSDLTKRMMYLQADILNLQKQSAKKETQARDDAALKYLLELISLKEDLERALTVAGEETPLAIKDGLGMVISRINSDLRMDSVERIKVDLGSDFDPRLEEAISYNQVEGRKDGTVTGIVSQGYTYGGKVIKPVLVEVARQKGTGERMENRIRQVKDLEIEVDSKIGEERKTESK